MRKLANTAIKCLLLSLMWVPISGLKAQDFSAGFSMLEKGQFVEARSFFSEQLQKDSSNFTALICYGRATGLSGNILESQGIFRKLLIMKPGNVEVLLNLAESYLWDKNGKQAADLYVKIITDQPDNFAATLGYANSLSMTKQYEKAYQFIHKALQLEPNNAQAKVSRKFIRLGYADYLAAQQGEYEKALELVNDNLLDNATDQNSWMLKATIYLLKEEYRKSEVIYESQITNPLDRCIGRSTTAHLLENDDEALTIIQKGLIEISQSGDSTQILKLKRQYVSALLWSDKLKEAEVYTKQLIEENPNNKDLLVTQATVLTYMSDYRKGAEIYQRFLKRAPDSFSGNLGLADANHALGMDDLAYSRAFTALRYFPGQKDILNFIDRLNFSHVPEVGTRFTISRTSDGSQRLKTELFSTASVTPRLKVSGGIGHEIFSDTNGEDVNVQSGSLGINYRLNKRLRLEASTQFNQAEGPEFSKAFMNHQVLANIRIDKNHQLVAGVQKELQNFNKNLLLQNISMSHFLIKNMSFWKVMNIGWYSEIYRTELSDGNSRNLLFTSLYKNLTKAPAIKTGLNFTAMSFAQSKPEEYYSPEAFYNFEWFAGIGIDQSKNLPFSLQADMAIGYQLSDQNENIAWRTKVEAKRIMKRWIIKAHFQHNSLSVIDNNGFRFSQGGVSILYKLAQQPLFYNRIKSRK